MNFHSPTLADKEWVEKAFLEGQTDCCEYCFGNIYMWSDIYDNRIFNDNGIFALENGSHRVTVAIEDYNILAGRLEEADVVFDREMACVIDILSATVLFCPPQMPQTRNKKNLRRY